MKRVLLICLLGCASLVLLVAVGLGFLLATFDPNDYKGQISAAIEKATGRQLVFQGNIETTLFPQLGLKTEKLRLNDPGIFGSDPFATIEKASFKLAVEPLTKGIVEVEEITLDGVTLKLATTTAGLHNWKYGFGESENGKTAQNQVDDAGVTPLADPQEQQGKEAAPSTRSTGDKRPAQMNLQVQRVDCTNVQVVYRDMRQGTSYKAVVDTFSLRDVRLGADVPVTLSGKVSDENTGRKADVTLEATVRVEQSGDISAKMANLAITAKGIGDTPLTLKNQAELSYAATTRVLTVRDLKGSLDSTGYTGGFTVALPEDKKAPRVEGQLDIGTLNFTPLMGKLEAATPAPNKALTGAPNLSNVKVTVPKKSTPGANSPKLPVMENGEPGSGGIVASAGVDTNITVTAKTVILDTLQFTDAKVSLISSGKQAKLPYSLNAFGGSSRGELSADYRKATPAMGISATAKDMQAGSLAAAFAGKRQVSGVLSGSVDVTGQGTEWKEMAPTLKGTAAFQLDKGEVMGFSLIPSGLPGIKAVPADFPFERISGSMKIDKGIGISKDIAMLAKVITAKGGGTVNMVHEQMDLGIDFMLDGRPPAIPVNIQGPFNSLSYGVDMQILLRNTAESALESPERAGEIIRGVKGLFDRR